MPKKHPTEARTSGPYGHRLNDYPSMWAVGKDLAPMLNIGAEAPRNRVTQAQADAGERTGPTGEELEAMRRLKRENRDLRVSDDTGG
jgi:transposase